MFSPHDFKIIFYLTCILIICLSPLYLYRRNWKEVSIAAFVIIYFFILNKNLIWGKLGCYHDTRFTYEYFLLIFKQWLDGGLSIGWNPYMSGGEPLYLFSNYFLRAAWILFSWINKFISVNSHTLFNLFWVFQFVNFCIGGLLLFLILYDDFRVSLFCFIALIMSGMFIINLGQPTGLVIMYYFPYILFCLILSWKRKSIYGISLAIIFLGIASNHYLPHYIILVTAICIFFFLAFNLWLLRLWLSLLKSQYKIILLCLVIFLLAASPALFLAKEAQKYVSPSRGGFQRAGALQLDQTGYQPRVNAPLSDYRLLLEQNIKYTGVNIHHGFYFGIIPLLLIPISLLRWRNKYLWAILASTIAVLFLGTGNDFWGFRLLIKYIPTFNMIRHSFGLSHFVSFLLICVAGYGFKELLQKGSTIITNLKLLALSVISFSIMLLISKRPNVILFGILSVGALISIVFIKQIISSTKIKIFFTRQSYLLIILLLLVDLTLFYQRYHKTSLVKEPPVSLTNIVYPQERSFCPLISYPLPPDLSSLIFKKASLTHSDENFILFRHSRLNDLLRLFIPQKGYEPALGVNTPMIYFSQNAKIFPKAFSKKQIIESLYQDASLRNLAQNRNVFFSEKDIDFNKTYNSESLEKALIKYTKIRDPNELEISIETPTDGFLVRLENFHPKWQAFINDKKTRIYRANYAFQAIRIPRGKHTVRFRFSTIHPFLLYVHVFCVFLTWAVFNFYLFNIGRNNYPKQNDTYIY